MTEDQLCVSRIRNSLHPQSSICFPGPAACSAAEIPAAVLTLLWAYGAYPLYCRIAARNGLDPVRMTAFYICPGVLGVMMASVWLFARLPFLNALFSVLPPFLSLIFCITLGSLCWFAPVALFVSRRTASPKD